jgi:hypothetical protein
MLALFFGCFGFCQQHIIYHLKAKARTRTSTVDGVYKIVKAQQIDNTI